MCSRFVQNVIATLFFILLCVSNISEVAYGQDSKTEIDYELIGTLDDYPVLLNLTVIDKLTEISKKLKASQEVNGAEENRVQVLNQILLTTKVDLLYKFDIVNLKEDEKIHIQDRFELSDNKSPERMKAIKKCLVEYVKEEKPIDSLYQQYCTSLNISEKELQFYVSKLQKYDDPMIFIDRLSLHNPVELVKRWMYMNTSSVRYLNENLEEIILSEDQKQSNFKPLWYEIELLEFLKNNLEIVHQDYQWLSGVISNRIVELKSGL